MYSQPDELAEEITGLATFCRLLGYRDEWLGLWLSGRALAYGTNSVSSN